VRQPRQMLREFGLNLREGEHRARARSQRRYTLLVCRCIDFEHYDTHFKPGAYLPTHTEHIFRWHGGT
jgi:hypothetical protein